MADAVLCSDSAAARSQLEQALGTDPPFALWAACRWQPPAATASLEALAGWLAEQTAAKLSGIEFVGERANRATGEQVQGEWERLRQRGCRIAHSATQLLASGVAEEVRSRAFLLGLLADALEMLNAAGPAVTLESTSASPSCLPPWLSRVLGAIHGTNGRDAHDPALQAVRRAIAEFAAARRPTTIGQSDLATLDADAVANRPASPADGCLPRMLPALVARMARLEELECDFGRQLEDAKLQAIRNFAYGASHEINNPLANISSRAQTLLVGETDPERRKKLATINAQAFRAFEMIADAMLFAKPPRLNPAPVGLLSLIDQVLDELAPAAADQATELRRQYEADELTLVADAEYLSVAIRALVRNSLEAVAAGGHVEVSVRPLADVARGGPGIEIAVQDTGPGIPDELRPHLFDPYFSGRESGRGLGFGLSKCWRVVTLHGGRIDLESPSGAGARFVIRLPQDATDATTPAARTTARAESS